jgi:hypothetical protein
MPAKFPHAAEFIAVANQARPVSAQRAGRKIAACLFGGAVSQRNTESDATGEKGWKVRREILDRRTQASDI